MPYVIIGGDAAGMSAALQIRKYDAQAEIITLEKGNIYSYAQCGLPYVLTGEVNSIEDLIVRDAKTFRKKNNIDARTNTEVTSVDTTAKVVVAQDVKAKVETTIPYHKLLIATGGDPFVPNWEGSHLKGVFTLKTIPDLQQIKHYLENDVQQVTIIGGGYVGLEMVESLSLMGKKVRLIIRSSQVASMFDEEMAELIHEEARKNKIELILNEDTKRITGEKSVHSVITDKGEYQTDLLFIATGIKPNTSFLEDSGIKMGVKGELEVNSSMETNIKDIYAAGDCAQHFHRIKNKPDYTPLGTTANKQGRIAGMNMVGQAREYVGTVGTSILRFFNLTLGKTGLSIKEAKQLQMEIDSIKIKAKDIAGYFPNPKSLTIKLVYDKRTNRLLGGQIIGEKGVDKRIDVLATALYNKMTLKEVEDLDLSYAPPYNGVWDPIQRAARRRN